MKRLLKVFLVLLALVLLAPLAGILSIYGYYRSIVWPKPGGLEVPVSPGPLGAMVDVFIGTGGVPWMCAHDTPAATTPFGMVRLGPDTASILNKQRGLNRSGYFYGDNKIIGFSHTRLVGADAHEGGHFRVFPTVASRLGRVRPFERFTRFSHRKETAFPGYYAVWLPREGVLAELTAAPRTGVHRYTFHKNETPQLSIEVTSLLGRGRSENGLLRILPDKGEIEGSMRGHGSFSGRYGGLDAYFVARFNPPFTEHGVWDGGDFRAGMLQGAGNDIGAELGFAKTDAPQTVELRLAISYVSIENARENLEAEAAGRSFEEIYAAARDAWENRFETIRIEGGDDRQRTIFYSALYRSFQMPTHFNDVNGEYMGFDAAVHRAGDFRYYTDFSLWDTFRTVHPLYNLIARADQRDMMVSFVEMAKAGGALPRWPSGRGYANSMFGTPADMTVSEAYRKGIRDFDIETAYTVMRQTAISGPPEGSRFSGRRGFREYLELGYCPADKVSGAVSATLEYAWADHALSLLAEDLGHPEDTARFGKQAGFYRNVWNPETLFFQPRDSEGRFQEIKPLLLSYVDSGRRYTRAYVEGSAMQWRWGVPFDPEGLVALFPSPERFVEELEVYFQNSKPGVGGWNPGGYYWHGNEPYIHTAYLFNAAGRPDLSQKWVRWILENKYSDTYYGLDGNDDGGTLSAWYVLSAMGFYPIAGTTKYELGSPLFDLMEIDLGDNTLRVIAENNTPDHPYVQSVHLNGVPLEVPWFSHEDIAQGGEIRFVMGPRAK